MKSSNRLSRGWFVRALLVLSLCLPIWLAPQTTFAGGNTAPDRQARNVDFFAAVDGGLISYVARGRGVASGPMVELTLTNLTDEALNIMLPPASRFIPAAGADLPSGLKPVSFAMTRGQLLAQGGGSQPGVGGAGYSLYASGGGYNPLSGGLLLDASPAAVNIPGGVLARPARQAGSSRTIYVEAYCTQAHQDNPSPETLYTIFPPENDELSRLIQAAQEQNPPASTIAMQIAVWTVTDDVDLDFLREVGYDPNDADLYQALMLLQAAGIDLSNRQMGQVEMPPAPPAPGDFQPGESKAVQVRGSVVSEDGTPIEGALVFLAINGSQHNELRLDVSTGRGRFDAVISVYEDDGIDLIVFELGQEAGRLHFSAPDLATLFDGGAEIVITLQRGLLPAAPQATNPGFGASPVTLFGVRQIAGSGNIRSEPTTASAVLGRLGCATQVVAIDGQTTGADGLLWYHLAQGGWMRLDTLSVYESRDAAEDALANTNCAAPPPTQAPPAQEQQPAAPQGDTNQPPQQTGGGESPSGGGGTAPTAVPPTAEPTTSYNVTIENQTSCNASVSFGPWGGGISAGGSASFSVNAGTYSMSADAGACGSLNTSYTINADAVITLSN